MNRNGLSSFIGMDSLNLPLIESMDKKLNPITDDNNFLNLETTERTLDPTP